MADRPHLARLTWTDAVGDARESLLGVETVVVGRGDDCGVTVPDTRVSRHHAEIRHEGGAFSVLDLGSVNGTYVNDERVERLHRLGDGDRLRIGPVVFQFDLLPEPASPEVDGDAQRPTHVVPEPDETAWLEVESGLQRGVRLALHQDRVVIGRAGRGQQWDLVLQDRSVSRPHAEISRRAQEFILCDLDSANGTLVNGEPLDGYHTLAEGDALLLGETILVFHRGGGD